MSVLLVFSLLCAHGAAAAERVDATKNIPPRPPHALTGSQFAKLILHMDSEQRELAIHDQLLEGNLPDFLRNLVAVKLPAAGRAVATIFVMPEYLAIGSDSDYLRIPMNLRTAIAVARRFGFVLPTRKIVDAVYNQSAFHYSPQPLPPGPQMQSTAYYQRHNELIEGQSRTRGVAPGALVSGHKKDVVITNRLTAKPGQIAIYGWHRAAGAPIQPLSTVHGAGYADYSHGIRLVSATALVDGSPRPIQEILADANLSSALSDEGPMRNITEVLGLASYSRLLQQRNPR